LGCSIQHTYYNADMSTARNDEQRGHLAEAEANYASAVWRARNHLGKQEQSTALYNLGSFYRRHAKFKESAVALEESLSIAKDAGTFDQAAIGRRRIELAVSYAGLDRWKEGAALLREIIPVASQYTGQEAEFLKLVFSKYKERLIALGEDASFIPN